MQSRILESIFAGILFSAGIGASARAADEFAVDPVHSGASFKISHIGLSWVQGRFNSLSGKFTIDAANPGNCSFEMTVNATSVDTNNAQRDEHLRSPDFFNVKQFPAITFKSTAVKTVKDGYEVTGDLMMHGVTKPITFSLVGGHRAEFPKGVQRTGFSADLKIKRSGFGIDRFAEAVGDEVPISLSFEGTMK